MKWIKFENFTLLLAAATGIKTMIVIAFCGSNPKRPFVLSSQPILIQKRPQYVYI